VYIYPNKSSYAGEWKDDEKEGFGIIRKGGV